MHQPVVHIDCGLIGDWASFHDVLAAALEFPSWYGRNLDALVDCLSYPEDLFGDRWPEGSVLVLVLDDAAGLKTRCPDIWSALIECAGFVNRRNLESGEPATLVLAY